MMTMEMMMKIIDVLMKDDVFWLFCFLLPCEYVSEFISKLLFKKIFK
jgi:hypothetical protein